MDPHLPNEPNTQPNPAASQPSQNDPPHDQAASNPQGQPIRTINYNTNYNTNYENGKKKKGCLFWGLVVLAIFITVNGLLLFGGVAILGGIVNQFSSSTSTAETAALADEPYVEVLYLEGTLIDNGSGTLFSGETYSHSWTLQEIASLQNDPQNRGLLLYINSGGGGTYESHELYEALQSYKTATGRPIYAYYAQTAASGALYASMAADEIYANPMSLTGSIGVLLNSYNVSGLMEKLGIEDNTIASGPNKTMLSQTSPTSSDQKAMLQQIIDEYYDIFVSVVAEGRGMSEEEVRLFSYVRVLSPQQALSLGLIDGILSFDSFLQDMANHSDFAGCAFLSAAPPHGSLWDELLAKLPQSPLQSAQEAMQATSGLRPMYLMQ